MLDLLRNRNTDTHFGTAAWAIPFHSATQILDKSRSEISPISVFLFTYQ